MNLLPIALFSMTMSITPGPNNFMIMNSGMNFGIKKSLPHLLGIALGFPVMLLLLAAGMGSIFTKYPWIASGFKIVGALYMLYLAWRLLTPYIAKTNDKNLKPLNFIQASLFQWVNPKGWLMAISATSLFTLTNNLYTNALGISAIFLVSCMISAGTWLFFGSFIQTLLNNEKKQKYFNISLAILLVASIFLIFE